ncbi:hypothetical protein SAMN02745116_01968 [Pilibacter termitis]|uniref:Uncharacterized protein n=1 Tax=Pilibacter termitis TaxID=263852 RepID=A0A1T4PX23_9ENTE|nr:hypothetical protein [Pilibacter termitis]SJZ96043.1 hypothetical protein SAMN02745116_01968 [Pilibacter termitis]
MGKYYNVAFHVLNDRVLVKKEVYSEKEPFDVWEDACTKVSEKHLYLFVDDQFITLDRQYVVRVDVREVDNPMDKEMKRKGLAEGVVQKLSDMGF